MPQLAEPELQARDDPELLECMLSDLQEAPEIYRPTSYWAKYCDGTVSYLRSKGLTDFRRTEQGFLPSLGAGDLHFVTTPLRTLAQSDLSQEKKEELLQYLNLLQQNPKASLLPFGLSVTDLHETAYRMAELYGHGAGAGLLSTVSASLIGRPVNTFTMGTRVYTHSFLNYYWRYAYCSQFARFDRIDNIVEIGSGAGKQVEVIKKLHPHINFYLLDLAPSLYICSQFLKGVFPDDVVDYRDSRGHRSILADRPGRIMILSNAQVDDIAPEGTTLFWNAASFGEMEPPVVENYLQVIKPMSDAVFLFQCMGGKEKAGPERGGVLEQTKLEHYRRYLGDEFDLVDRWQAFSPLKCITQSGGYEDTFWIKSSSRSKNFVRG